MWMHVHSYVQPWPYLYANRRDDKVTYWIYSNLVHTLCTGDQKYWNPITG